MVGRDAELSRLSHALRAVRAGRGRVAVLLGEPGIGKSRLATELRRHATDPPVPWLEARCVSYGQEVPYALALGIVRAALGLSDEGTEPAAIRDRLMTVLGSAASHVGPHMAQLLSLDLEPWEHEEVIGLAPDALRAAYIEGIGALLRSTVGEPTVLVCEDVHWADEASVDLLVPLLRLVHELPMLVMLLARPDRDIPGWRLIGATRDEFGDALVELRIAGLPQDQSRTLVGNLLVIESLPSATRLHLGAIRGQSTVRGRSHRDAHRPWRHPPRRRAVGGNPGGVGRGHSRHDPRTAPGPDRPTAAGDPPYTARRVGDRATIPRNRFG
jgi:predicted ATPase